MKDVDDTFCRLIFLLQDEPRMQRTLLLVRVRQLPGRQSGRLAYLQALEEPLEQYPSSIYYYHFTLESKLYIGYSQFGITSLQLAGTFCYGVAAQVLLPGGVNAVDIEPE